MQLKTILNRVEKYQSFVYGNIRLIESGPGPVLKVSIRPRTNSQPMMAFKRRENLTAGQEVSLRQLLKYNLKTVRSYLLKEDFQCFWEYVSPFWAGVFLDRWCTRAMRSRIVPMQKGAKMIRRHRELILN